MPFLDKTGLAHLWNQIIARLNGKASVEDLTALEDTLRAEIDSAGSGIPIVTTSGTGAAYTATIPGIEALTAGASFIMIPHTESTSTTPTLNVNDLGAKTIKRGYTVASGIYQSGYSPKWLTSQLPILVIYNGSNWIVQGMTQTYTDDLNGTLQVNKGGTGNTTLTAGSFLIGDGTSAVQLKTPAEALAHMGITATAEDINSTKTTVTNVQTQVNSISTQVADKAPAYSYGTEDLEAGVSELPSGTLYFVYE